MRVYLFQSVVVCAVVVDVDNLYCSLTCAKLDNRDVGRFEADLFPNISR